MRPLRRTCRISPPRRSRPPVASRCSTSPRRAPQRSKADRESAALLERAPHLDIALGGPDAWIADTAGLIVGTADVEWHAVVEDRESAELRAQAFARRMVDRRQRLASLAACAHIRQQFADKFPRLLDRDPAVVAADHRVAAPRHERLWIE